MFLNFKENENQEGNIVIQTDTSPGLQALDEVCSMSQVSFCFPEDFFLMALDPTSSMAPRHKAYLVFDFYKRFHSHKVASEDFHSKTRLGGWKVVFKYPLALIMN